MMAVMTYPPPRMLIQLLSNILWVRMTEQNQGSKQKMSDVSIPAAMDAIGKLTWCFITNMTLRIHPKALPLSHNRASCVSAVENTLSLWVVPVTNFDKTLC